MGHSVKCPGCSTVFTAAVDSPEPPPLPEEKPEPEVASVTPRRKRPREDEYDDEPLDDDEDDRPRRRRRRRLDAEPHRGGMILTFGILSFVICGPIFGPMAWIMGSGDLRKMREGTMDSEGEGLTKAGMICGIIATCLSLVGCVFYALFFSIGAMGGFR